MKYKYHRETRHPNAHRTIDAMLERLGNDGWELVSTTGLISPGNSAAIHFYFKKMIEDD